MSRIAIVLITLLAMGCSSVGGNRLPNEARSDVGLYYVQHQPKDGRNLHRLIAEALRDRGFKTLSGVKEERPTKADYYVNYEDRWRWDMRMYLLELKIDVHEADTGKVIGYGRSYQPSLSAMGMSYRDVVDRALDALLDGKVE